MKITHFRNYSDQGQISKMICKISGNCQKKKKKPHVRTFSACDSRAGNGCAHLPEIFVLCPRQPSMPITFLVLGGGEVFVFFFFWGGGNLVAFQPRPQIASDLGRNVTRNFNPHRNRNQFPSGNEILAYGRRFKSQPASTRCDLRIASPTRPFLQVI